MFSLIVLLMPLILSACDNNTIGPAKQISGTTLSLENVSCIEAWLKIAKGDAPAGTKITLNRNDKEVLSFYLSGKDTVLCDENLSPSNTYTYQVFLNQPNIAEGKTNTVTARTMDTTSHNITWQTWTFGQSNPSIFYNAAITNDNDIWTVGETYFWDSLGAYDPMPYNTYHWDGIQWERNKINISFDDHSIIPPIYGIFTLPSSEKVIAVGSPCLQSYGKWKLFHLWEMGVLDSTEGGVTKVWGRNINEVYFCGRNGSAVFYDGGNFHKIDVNIKYDFGDIWGIIDKNDNSTEIYMPCVDIDGGSYKSKIFKITNKTKVDTINWIGKEIATLWTNDGKIFYVGGYGMYENKRGYWQKTKMSRDEYICKIRGTDVNNIIACGVNGLVLHYNGISWHEYTDFSFARWYSVSIKNNLIVLVGETVNFQAVVTIGKIN